MNRGRISNLFLIAMQANRRKVAELVVRREIQTRQAGFIPEKLIMVVIIALEA
jgi:hypothetical protein